MLFALLEAGIARNGAQEARVRGELGTVFKEKRGCTAEEGAVAIQCNASHKLLNMGTLYAGLGALIARLVAALAGFEARLVVRCDHGYSLSLTAPNAFLAAKARP